MPTCPFNRNTLSFLGDAVSQARCLLRKVMPFGNVGSTPASLPAILESIVGRPCDVTRAQLAGYLASHGIHTSEIGGELDQPVSSTDGDVAPATHARYFMIHDTSTPHRDGHFTAATAIFPPSINTTAWSGNNLSNAVGMTTHVMLARTGESATSNNYRTAMRATKRERLEVPGHPNALRGLFLHHELVQPRLLNNSNLDEFSPDPGFTPGQYERLAVCYHAAAVRSGTFLIPAFHCVLDMEIPDGHDDPQHFDLAAWGAALQAVRAAILGTTISPVIPGASGILEHSIVNSPDGSANVRSGTSTSADVIAVLHNGDEVDVFEKQNPWRRIAATQAQWIHGSLLAPTTGGGGGGEGGSGGDNLRKITDIAAVSAIAKFNWPGRGAAPIGYTKGMAVTFARAFCKLRAGDPVAVEMAKAATGKAADDCLVHYKEKFASLGMDNSVAGVETLRHLFVLMLGLGMRESSGQHCCGRDRSVTGFDSKPDNVKAEIAEAGLFQTSWDGRSENALMAPLFEHYRDNPGTGFLDIFHEKVSCSAQDLENHGTGTGVIYQKLAKECPAFHTEFTALAMRNTSQHWGPIIKRAALLKSEADDMFRKVQHLVETEAICPV